MRTAPPPTLARLMLVLVVFGSMAWCLSRAADAAPAQVPPILVRMINATYGPDPDGTHGSPDTVKNLTAKYGKVADAFEARWQAFTARKADVDKAIAAGDALAQAGKYDDAIAAVAAVITPIARDTTGQLPKKRDVLEVRDAELGAVLAWSRYAEAKKDFSQAPDVAAAIYVRRKTGSEADEELLWFGAAEEKSLGFLMGSEDDNKLIKQVIEDAYRAPQDGRFAAWGYYKSLDTRFGLVKSAAEDSTKVKKGGGVIMDITPTKMDEKKLTLVEDEEWNEPYGCTLSDKIDAIDPETGKVTYKEQCQYRSVKRHTELKGTLAAPPPDWAHAGGDDTLTIAGHVDAGGPKWVLSNVRVLDFRFIKGGDDNATMNILDQLGTGD
jgi:hypothetical protein